MRFSSNINSSTSVQKAVQDFLNKRVIDLPNIQEQDLELALSENLIGNVHTEPHPDYPQDTQGYQHTLQAVPLDPSTMTVREYMSYSMHADFYDPFIREESRNAARKAHPVIYEHIIYQCDDTIASGDINPAPWRNYLELFDGLTAIADGKANPHVPLSPQVLRDGANVIEELIERQQKWSDDHMQKARSASSLEDMYYHRISYNVLHHLKEHGTLPETGLSDTFRKRLEMADIAALARETYAIQENSVRSHALRGLLDSIHDIAETTQPMDYALMAHMEMGFAKPIDAAARINEHLLEELTILAPKLGLGIKVVGRQ